MAEIAEEMNLSISGVEKIKRTGLKKLREYGDVNDFEVFR